MGHAYQGALEAVFAVVLAMGAGYWADSAFGTSPWCLLAGATIGFAAFVLRLYRLGTSLNQVPAEPESPDAEIHTEERSEGSAGHPGRGAGSSKEDRNGAR